jgi:hypothetical protein
MRISQRLRKAMKALGSWLKIVPIQVALIGGICALAGAFIPTIQNFYANRAAPILTCDRVIVYARMIHFRDRRLNEKPVEINAFVGDREANVGQQLPLYDEALHVNAMYLHNHSVSEMAFALRSSGHCYITPIIPNTIRYDSDEYKRSGFSRLDGAIPLRDDDSGEVLRYVLVANNFYNGYQYDGNKGGYQSDTALRLLYDAKEVTFIVDFTALDYKTRVLTPKVSLRRKDGLPFEDVQYTYKNGVVVSAPVHNLHAGAYMKCDWEWSTERIEPAEDQK